MESATTTRQPPASAADTAPQGWDAFELRDLCADVAAAMAAELGRRGISLSHRAPAGLCVVADRDLVRSVLVDLVRDAIARCADHPAQPAVHIDAHADDGTLTIGVSDNGRPLTARPHGYSHRSRRRSDLAPVVARGQGRTAVHSSASSTRVHVTLPARLRP